MEAIKKRKTLIFYYMSRHKSIKKELSDIVPSLKRIEIFSFSNYLEKL